MDRKTESLNQSGTFLQISILNNLKKQGWRTESESPRTIAPFVYNPCDLRQILYSNDPNRLSAELFPHAVMQSQDFTNKEETSLDIYADKEIKNDHGNFTLRLCIESKKNDPRFNDWCFFQLESKCDYMQVISSNIQNIGTVNLFKVEKTNKCGNETFVQIYKPDYAFLKYDVSDFAISLKNKEVEKEYYKSEKSVIDSSVRQIIKGTYGTIVEHLIHKIVSGDNFSGNPDIFIPIIVTNANLFLCKFDIDDIEPDTAQITKDPEFQQIDGIIYEYPKPKEVQFPATISTGLDQYSRKLVLKWHVLILSPKGFVSFLNEIDKNPIIENID